MLKRFKQQVTEAVNAVNEVNWSFFSLFIPRYLINNGYSTE